jgi:hypothetical protein
LAFEQCRPSAGARRGTNGLQGALRAFPKDRSRTSLIFTEGCALGANVEGRHLAGLLTMMERKRVLGAGKGGLERLRVARCATLDFGGEAP